LPSIRTASGLKASTAKSSFGSKSRTPLQFVLTGARRFGLLIEVELNLDVGAAARRRWAVGAANAVDSARQWLFRQEGIGSDQKTCAHEPSPI
jgi:hypothetical protein